MAQDNRRYGLPPQQPELALYQIVQEAQHRWLRPTEVCEVLHNYRKFMLTPDPPQRPQSGSLFLFDRKALRYFRKDGHNWRKKKDGKTVREAHERLKVGSIDVLHCYYAHGSENENFQRRSYWLLEGAFEHIVLVHYREVKEGSRTNISRSWNGCTPEAAQSPSYSPANTVTMSSPLSSPFVSPHASPSASSPNSAEWNGNSLSPECDEPDSGDDNQYVPCLDLLSKQQIPLSDQFSCGVGSTINSRPLEPCTSFSTRNSCDVSSEGVSNCASHVLSSFSVKAPILPNNTASASCLSTNQIVGYPMQNTFPDADHQHKEGHVLPPGGFDLLEWTEYMSCTQPSIVNKTYERPVKGEASLPTWTELLDHCSNIQQQNSLQSVVSSSIGVPCENFDSKLQTGSQSQILNSVQSLVDASYPKASVRDTNTLIDGGKQQLMDFQNHEVAGQGRNTNKVQWYAVFEQPVDSQTKPFNSFEQEKHVSTPNLSSHFQFQQREYYGEQHLPILLEELGHNTSELTTSQTHPQVFIDFQADNPSHHEENENLKKLDSFGSWMTKEIVCDDDDSLLTVSSVSAASWLTGHSTAEFFNPSYQMQPSMDSNLLSQNVCFKIIDFSPDYAISGAKTKVLITGIFSITVKNPSDYKWCCMFGEVEAPAELLQTGVLRCTAPPHLPGRVSFFITQNDGVACSEMRDFEYRAVSSFSEICSLPGGSVSNENKDILRLQLHLSQMLSSGLNATQNLQRHGCEESSILKDKLNHFIKGSVDTEWSEMENCLQGTGDIERIIKEQLIETLIKEKLLQWLFSKVEDEGKGASVLNDHGLGVIHIGAALGYNWIIAPVLYAGVSVNFRDARGWTALHWAAYYGREGMVVTLLAAAADPGAKTDPTPRFPAGQTPADLASSRGHKGISGYLAESSLTSHLTLLTLHESMTENFSATPSDEKAVEIVSERSIVQHDISGSEDQLSLQDSLAAVRNAAQAAARIRATFRMQSFKKKQEAHIPEEDEYGITDEEARSIIAAQKMQKSGRVSGEEALHSAAIRIQKKFRGWKGRKDFLLFRQHIVKIQAHVRGHQVRKHYRNIVWSVGIVEKVILRWRRKGKGLRGFSAEMNLVNGGQNAHADSDGDDDFLKVGRKQTEAGLEKALARVKSMVKSREARDQYRRLLEGFHKAKDQFDACSVVSSVTGECVVSMEGQEKS